MDKILENQFSTKENSGIKCNDIIISEEKEFNFIKDYYDSSISDGSYKRNVFSEQVLCENIFKILRKD